MNKTNIYLLVGSCLALAGLTLMISQREKENASSSIEPIESKSESRYGARTYPSERTEKRKAHRPPSAVRSENTSISKWNQLHKLYSGSTLENQRYKLLAKILNDIDGPELGQFIEHLSKEGDSDFLMTALDHAGSIVIHPYTEEGIEWLANMDNTVLQARMMPSVGFSLTQEQVAELMAKMPSTKSKENLLSGHCTGIAAYNGTLAYERFKEMKDDSMDFSGLKGVFLSLGKNTKFQELSKKLPADKLHIAAEVRGALLHSWTRHSPKDAADYVVGTPELVEPIQLKSVVLEWLKTDDKKAQDWVSNLSPSKYQDIGFLAISEKQMRTDPAKAWGMAEAIADPVIREAAIKQVHQQWAKYDEKAAAKARKDYKDRHPTSKPDGEP